MKEVITQLEHDASLQLNYGRVSVTLPVQLLQSYGKNITFSFNEVTTMKRNDVLSELYDFQLFAGVQEKSRKMNRKLQEITRQNPIPINMKHCRIPQPI
ncbi:hypothetical protein ACTWP4_00940 [Gracilibacillus sp. D59]|uniref:hypothetical protein n=1 Tax=Gracilibacillus sp. D59 TaxID=3457434 RepID=UPI003FCC30B5